MLAHPGQMLPDSGRDLATTTIELLRALDGFCQNRDLLRIQILQECTGLLGSSTNTLLAIT